jgi:hypothetical protein
MSPEVKSKPGDLLVIAPVKAFTCADCGTTEADLMRLEDNAPALPGLHGSRPPSLPAVR